uniref:F-box domain-containing protein n=1 Tax=Macrostomum lignano TaxID=282301 RepID=A0A1I8H376_9PLAT
MLAPVSGGQRRSSLRPSGSRRNLALAANNGFLAEDSSAMSNFNFNDLPSKLALRVFSYLSHKDLCLICQVCSRWRELAYDTRLWKNVGRLRLSTAASSREQREPVHRAIGCRCISTGLRDASSCELIIVPVLEEHLARQCAALHDAGLQQSDAAARLH